jgi:CheY-like chemotaxis protein
MDILLVEDNPADARLVREALTESALPAQLHWTSSGEAALAYLRGTGALSHQAPDLVLMDLNLPGLNGQELLATIKTDPAFKRIPVVVLTSSSNPTDVHAAYDRHCNAYLVKPQDYDEFLALVGSLHHYWLRCVLLPGHAG